MLGPIEKKQASIAPAVSATNCWASFALQNLDDGTDEILPPKTEMHVVEWIPGFRNGGTASNYLGILRWVCRIKGCSAHWDTDKLKLLIKGLKKLTLSQMASKLHGDLPLLNDAVVCSVAKLAKAGKMIQFHALHLISWYFLGRVQSEVLPLQTGVLEDFKGLMPFHRHPGVVVTEGRCTKTLHIRWARRQNTKWVSVSSFRHVVQWEVDCWMVVVSRAGCRKKSGVLMTSWFVAWCVCWNPYLRPQRQGSSCF